MLMPSEPDNSNTVRKIRNKKWKMRVLREIEVKDTGK